MTLRMSRRSVAAGAGVGAPLAGRPCTYWAGVSGSTKQGRAPALPGGDLIMSPSLVTNHAATLDAPPEQVWLNPKWLDLAHLVTIVPADLMTPGMFRGLQQRARQ